MRKKRKYELGRPAANTKVSIISSIVSINSRHAIFSENVRISVGLESQSITHPHRSAIIFTLQLGVHRVHPVRTRGGNTKYRALRLDSGNFAWASEGTARKTRVIDVVYNASNNELVRTKTLVKNAIVIIDATPFRQWYESHYVLPLGRKRDTKSKEGDENDVLTKKRSKKALSKYVARQKFAKVDAALEEQFSSGRLLGECPTIEETKLVNRTAARWFGANGTSDDKL